MSAIRGTLRQQAELRTPELTSEEVERMIEYQVTSVFDWYGSNFHTTLSDETDEAIRENFIRFRQTDLGNNKYDEILIDEAQDLRPGVIAAAFEVATKISCGADRSQDIQGHYSDPADDVIHEILNQNIPTTRQALISNFRNTKEIFEFARQFVPEDQNVQQLDTAKFRRGENPELFEGLSSSSQLQTILQIVRANSNSNIGILVHFKKKIIRIKEFLELNGYSCKADAQDNRSFSYYYSGMPPIDREVTETQLRTPFILTFDSCKGLEFDIVIMAYFEDSDWALAHTRSESFDVNGNPMPWVTRNHYYVAATRARNQLYLLFDRKPSILNFYQKTADKFVFTQTEK